jgi:hypothetical protein
MFEILFIFLHRRSQVRAGMHCGFWLSKSFLTIAALPLALDYGLGRVCRALWFFSHDSLRMLVRVPVHGMQGGLEKQKDKSF